MALYRPAIPLEVKLRVVLRQLGEMFPDDVIAIAKKNRCLARQLNGSLAMLASNLGCEVKDLRLDHDPALATRPQERRGLGKKTYYVPDANDPEFMKYRPHGAQFEGSHDVKTRIRGDHGQFSDIALIKRQRRRERPPKPKRPIPGKGFEKKTSRMVLTKPKSKWAKRPFNRGKK
jgi:hypothetical protein